MTKWKNINLFQDAITTNIKCTTSDTCCFCLAKNFFCFGKRDGSVTLVHRDTGENIGILSEGFSDSVISIEYCKGAEVLVALGRNKGEDFFTLKLWSLRGITVLHNALSQDDIRLFVEHKIFFDHYDEWVEESTIPPTTRMSISCDLSGFALYIRGDEIVFYPTMTQKRLGKPLLIKSRFGKGRVSLLSLASTAHSAGGRILISEEVLNRNRVSLAQSQAHLNSAHYILNKSEVNQNALYVVYEDTVSVWYPNASGEYAELLCPVPFGANSGCAAAGDNGSLALLKVLGNGSCQIATIGFISSIGCESFDPTSPSSVKTVTIDLPASRVHPWIHCFQEYVCVFSNRTGFEDETFLQCFDCGHQLRVLSPSRRRFPHCLFSGADTHGIVLLATSKEREEKRNEDSVCNLVSHTLKEQPTVVKLFLLLEREMYHIAKELAASLSKSRSENSERWTKIVSKLFAQNLYKNGYYTRAMEEFIGTIGFVEPSYVIIKYMKSKRLGDLAHYLEKLVSPKCAVLFSSTERVHHTELLLHTYIKLGAYERMMNYVCSEDATVNPEVVIQSLRNGAAPHIAQTVAQKFNLHSEYFAITFFDLRDTREAMEYLYRIPLSDAIDVFSRHEKDVMRLNPFACTNFVSNYLLPFITSSTSALDCQIPVFALQYSSTFADHNECFLYFLQQLYANSLRELSEDIELSSNLPQELLHSFLFLLMCEYPTLRSPVFTNHEPHPKIFIDSLAERRALAMKILRFHTGLYYSHYALLLADLTNFTEGTDYLMPIKVKESDRIFDSQKQDENTELSSLEATLYDAMGQNSSHNISEFVSQCFSGIIASSENVKLSPIIPFESKFWEENSAPKSLCGVCISQYCIQPNDSSAPLLGNSEMKMGCW